MGISVNMVTADSTKFKIIQTQENGGDVNFWNEVGGDFFNEQFFGDYSVVAGTAPPTFAVGLLFAMFVDPLPYGLQRYGFTPSVEFGIATTTTGSVMRFYKFQHQDENSATGAQYQVGDT